MKTLQELFREELMDVYDAEHQLIKALPELIEASENAELKTAFTNHLHETEMHVGRLEQVFAVIGQEPKRKKCAGMKGLIAEGSDMLEEGDAAIISAAQRCEHYEISAYGTLRAWAKTLGYDQVVAIIESTLDEESRADELLNKIAEKVNEMALERAA